MKIIFYGLWLITIVADATKAMGKTSHSQISSCANGRYETAYGYKWKFIKEEEEK